MKKAKDDLLKDTISVSKPEHFSKKRFTLILSMARIWVLIAYLLADDPVLSHQTLKSPPVHFDISVSSPAFRFNGRIVRMNASLFLGIGSADPTLLSKESELAQGDC